MMERFGILLFVAIAWLVLMDVTMLVIRYHCVQIIARVSWLGTWAMEGINPLGNCSQPPRGGTEWMTDSYSRTADLICQTHFSVFLSFCCSTLVTEGCHDVLEALSITRVSNRVRVDIAKDKKLQNLPEPVKSALSWAGRAGPQAGQAGGAYYAIQTFLLQPPLAGH